jgi:hypothetical protein
MTITRPDIYRLAKMMSSQPYVLQMASWETLHVLKEVLVKVTLGWSMLQVQLFAATIKDEFILGAECTASLWHGCASKASSAVIGPKRGVVLESLHIQDSDEVIPAQGGGVMTAWLEGPLVAANSTDCMQVYDFPNWKGMDSSKHSCDHLLLPLVCVCVCVCVAFPGLHAPLVLSKYQDPLLTTSGTAAKLLRWWWWPTSLRSH